MRVDVARNAFSIQNRRKMGLPAAAASLSLVIPTVSGALIKCGDD
jgi:hypothetical protein